MNVSLTDTPKQGEATGGFCPRCGSELVWWRGLLRDHSVGMHPDCPGCWMFNPWYDDPTTHDPDLSPPPSPFDWLL